MSPCKGVLLTPLFPKSKMSHYSSAGEAATFCSDFSVFYHKITKWLRLTGISGGHMVQSPAKQGHLERVVQDHV